MDSREIFGLRRAGKSAEALEAARAGLTGSEDDLWFLRAYAWALRSGQEDRGGPRAEATLRFRDGQPHLAIYARILADGRSPPRGYSLPPDAAPCQPDTSRTRPSVKRKKPPEGGF